MALPHPSVIRSWFSQINGETGFTSEAFAVLHARVKQAAVEKKEVVCSIMLDEMTIRKHVEWDGKRFCGFVDVGTDIEDDSAPVANEALVFMAVCLTEHWKIPLGYFFVSNMSGQERANLVKQCVMKLNDVGVRTVSLTCDGPSCHFTMMKELGASLEYPNIKPYFPHPADSSKKIYVLLDVCHMLKLTRNMVAQLQILNDMNGKAIRWKYFEELHCLQETEGLRLGNKLKSHINYEKQKMKVNLAAQTLSSIVADAIDFC